MIILDQKEIDNQLHITLRDISSNQLTLTLIQGINMEKADMYLVNRAIQQIRCGLNTLSLWSSSEKN